MRAIRLALLASWLQCAGSSAQSGGAIKSFFESYPATRVGRNDTEVWSGVLPPRLLRRVSGFFEDFSRLPSVVAVGGTANAAGTLSIYMWKHLPKRGSGCSRFDARGHPSAGAPAGSKPARAPITAHSAWTTPRGTQSRKRFATSQHTSSSRQQAGREWTGGYRCSPSRNATRTLATAKVWDLTAAYPCTLRLPQDRSPDAPKEYHTDTDTYRLDQLQERWHPQVSSIL